MVNWGELGELDEMGGINLVGEKGGGYAQMITI